MAYGIQCCKRTGFLEPFKLICFHKKNKIIMILDTNKRRLKFFNSKKEESFKLSVHEIRTLLMLSDNEKHPQEELRDFIGVNSCSALRQLICKLRKKIPDLEIQTHSKTGYRLLTTINIL